MSMEKSRVTATVCAGYRLWAYGLCAAVLFAATDSAAVNAVETMPLPCPQKCKTDVAAPVALDETATVTVDCPDDSAVAWLALHFKQWYGVHAPKTGRASVRSRVAGGSEAYTLRADPSNGVRIAANTLSGVRWAAYTLRQMAGVKRGTFKIEGRVLPSLEIADRPRLAFRGVHLCWFPETRPAQMERAIRLAAYLKFNYVVLETWGTFKSEVHPWRNWPDAPCTKAEARRLADIGRDLGVTVIPQMQIFGHASLARGGSAKHATLDMHPEYEPLFEPGGWVWCLANPHTQRVLRELVAEMHEAFGSPPWFHLGCDEANRPPCPLCAKHPRAKLVAGHIAGMAKFLKARGARSMVWHDMFVDAKDPQWSDADNRANGTAETAAALDLLPRDIVICDWQYQGNRQDAKKDWPTMEYFRSKGFDVCGCPYGNFRSFKPMADALAKMGGMGFIETTWNTLSGKGGWEKMYALGAAAAWGTAAKGRDAFANALRTVDNDMKVGDYRDTGVLNWQIPPESFQK